MGIYDQNPSDPGYAQAIRQALMAQGGQPMGMGSQGMPPQGQQMASGGAQAGAVNPQTVQAMLALQSQAPAQASIQRQLAQAQALRAQGQAGLKQQTFGNGQVAAPNWGGAIANVFAQKKAGDMEKTAGDKDAALGGARQDALRRYFESLSSRGGGGSQTPSSGGYDSGGMM